MALTPDLLRQVRLKSTSRDQALADKFIAIRNYNVPRNRPDARATITGEDIQVLQSLIARSSPTILVTNHVAASPFSGTRAEMVFRTTFKSQVPPAPPYRVIRFVRAAQVNHLIRRNKEEHTVPGYVCYETVSQQVAPALDPQAVQASLTKCFSMAKWSFDGPQQEFENGQLSNEDTPGTMASDLPYGIMADFLIALYDENARKFWRLDARPDGYASGQGGPAPRPRLCERGSG